MIGKVLGDRYEILELIGEGGMARVYKARCHLLNRFVAVKILRDEFAGDEEFVKKFRRESQAAASLSHPNILNIYDVGEEKIDGKDIHYIVMEYIKGKTLKEVILERGKLSSDETIDYSIQIGEALRSAHDNGIVHRDIKPQNIMVTEDNRIKVTDFGIARAVNSATITADSNALGSVHYISPEQARGDYTDEKSDIYSLGVVMFEMLTGKLPYYGDSAVSIALKHVQEEIPKPSDFDPSISKDLERIILKCVEKDQNNRYTNVNELIRDLKKIRNGTFVSQDTLPGREFETKVIPSVDDKSYANRAAERSKASQASPRREEKPKKAGVFKSTVLPILLAFVLVSGGFFGFIKLRGFLGVGQKVEVEVPGLLGMTYEEAENALKKEGLKIKVKEGTKDVDERFGPGEVISQDPKENTKVKEGYTIEVVLNGEAEMTKVPSLVNKTLEEAQKLLDEAELIIGEVKFKPSTFTPEDVILEQEPSAFTSVEPGTKVNIVVSEGEEELVTMPKVVGESVENAKKVLEDLELKVNITEEFSNDFEAGIVIWQSQVSGTEVETGTIVGLNVSKGPEEQSGENAAPEEETPPEVVETPEGSISIGVTPFTDRDQTEIKILRNRNGQIEEVYRKSHSASEGEISIDINAKDGDQFDIYFDGIFQFSRSK